ncbi:helix-turn-helix domain-containing protein, partial [Planctomycetota bacterium]
MAHYRHPQLAEFARQLLKYTPRPRKLEQLDRIRTLAASLQPDQSYPYDYVVQQITLFRPDDAPHVVFDAEALLADLMALHHELSDTLDLPVDWAGETVLSLDEVRRTYDVSLKTVRRWRARGLVAFRFVFDEGRKLTGVRQSDLEDFVEAHPDIIARTGAYCYIDAEARRAVVARAFELSLTEELAFGEAVGRLACEFGCAHGSVRALLSRYDREHPEAPIFAKAAQPLSDDERRQILALYRNGLDAHELSRAFLLGRSTVERVVRDLTIEDILDREWYYVPCEAFGRPDAEQAILGEPMPDGLDERTMAGPLAPDQETAVFRRYNYLKHLLATARDELTPSDLVPETIGRVLELHDQAVAVRNGLVVANLRLVVHLAA